MGEKTGSQNSGLRSFLIRTGTFALAVLLLYLTLRGVDLGGLWDIVRSAAFVWLIPLTIIVFASHLLRAMRWQVFLEALPHSTSHRLPVAKLFGALMTGYMVNYAAPRLGELVRTSIAARLSRCSFASVLGTVVAERILDMATLALALGTVSLILKDKLTALLSSIALPQFVSVKILAATAAGLTFALITVTIYAWRRQRNQTGDPGVLAKVISSFSTGLRTVLTSNRPGRIVATTIGMWFFYLLMAYIPLRMLGLTAEYDLALVDAWSLMNIGALGVVVPSPGGTGTYHYITQLALTNIWGVGGESAAAYAFITHAVQMILYVGAGFLSLLFLDLSLRSVLSSTESSFTVEDDED